MHEPAVDLGFIKRQRDLAGRHRCSRSLREFCVTQCCFVVLRVRSGHIGSLRNTMAVPFAAKAAFVGVLKSRLDREGEHPRQVDALRACRGDVPDQPRRHSGGTSGVAPVEDRLPLCRNPGRHQVRQLAQRVGDGLYLLAREGYSGPGRWRSGDTAASCFASSSKWPPWQGSSRPRDSANCARVPMYASSHRGFSAQCWPGMRCDPPCAKARDCQRESL